MDWDRLITAARSMDWQAVHTGRVTLASACMGTGSPTVVYLSGWGSPAAETWAPIAVEQSATNRVCVFDRPGVGLSISRDDQTAPTDPTVHAAELFDVVEAMGNAGPLLLVGWSYGGLVARAAATQAPDNVAGLVLVDHYPPTYPALVEQTDVVDGTPGIWWEAGHPIDLRDVAERVGPHASLGDRPVIVLQQGDPSVPAAEFDFEEWTREQRRATQISTNSLHGVVRNSDYAIPVRNPAAVLAATRAASESIQAGNAPLPSCPTDLAAAGVSCTAD